MIKAKIEQLLKETLKPSLLQVVDESHKHIGHTGSKEGGHYQVIIVSRAFEGKKMLEIHRMIYQALGPVKTSIHALAIKAKASE